MNSRLSGLRKGAGPQSISACRQTRRRQMGVSVRGAGPVGSVGGFKWRSHISKHADGEKSLREHGRGPLSGVHHQVRRRGRDQIRCGPRLCERLAGRRIGHPQVRTQRRSKGLALLACRWPAISPSLSESGGCGLLGGESAVSIPRMATTQRNTKTTENSSKNTERRVLTCPECGPTRSIRLDWGICADCAWIRVGGEE